MIDPNSRQSLRAFFLLTALTQGAAAFPQRRADFQATTNWNWYNCSDAQKVIINQANADAIVLLGPAQNWAWDSEAAIDYFGPPQENVQFRAHIKDTLRKLGGTYPSWGDWWNSRYVDLHCGGQYCPGNLAYEIQPENQKYPEIHFCPAYFESQPSLSQAIRKIEESDNWELRRNTANFDNQAVTNLHEWTHIRGKNTETCQGGCKDYEQTLANGEVTRTYRSGRAKLLAQRKTKGGFPAWNADNYGMFAIATYMQYKWGVYPNFPIRWDFDKSIAENELFETTQPGYQASSAALSNDAHNPTDASSTLVDGPLYPLSAYPAWYRPKLTVNFRAQATAVVAPKPSPLTVIAPHPKSVICETTSGSPRLEDCTHAFGALYASPAVTSLHGKKGGTWWAGYIGTCALAVVYEADWTDDCNSVLAEIEAHAFEVYFQCQQPGGATVGGQVRYANPKCPARVQISHTSGQMPPKGVP